MRIFHGKVSWFRNPQTRTLFVLASANKNILIIKPITLQIHDDVMDHIGPKYSGHCILLLLLNEVQTAFRGFCLFVQWRKT